MRKWVRDRVKRRKIRAETEQCRDRVLRRQVRRNIRLETKSCRFRVE